MKTLIISLILFVGILEITYGQRFSSTATVTSGRTTIRSTATVSSYGGRTMITVSSSGSGRYNSNVYVYGGSSSNYELPPSISYKKQFGDGKFGQKQQKKREQEKEELQELIKKHPDVFPFGFQYAYAHMTKKQIRILKNHNN